jgi:putative Ig domain-containing protein
MVWISSFAATIVAAFAMIGTSTAADPPRVTVIGDSVLTAVEWNATPLSILEQSLDVQLEIGVCRTLEGISCPYEGANVPTLLDVVNALGPRLGETVVVEVGYNDPATEFAKRVEDSVDALLAAGVQRILWVNMREWQQQYIGMNQILAAAAARHPQLTIVDWESVSHDHYSWFQGDGIHLVYDGAVALATLLNAAIQKAVAPALTIPAMPLPVAHVGMQYSVRLAAEGGDAPYRWRLTSGPLPRGLRLLADGRITGTPRTAGRLMLTLQAADRWGTSAVRRETLVILG